MALVWLSGSVAWAQGGSVVTVNADNVLVINGQKVFPMGFSPGPPNNSTTPQGKDALQEFRDAGALLFRIVQSSNWDSQLIAQQQAALDWAAQHGMYLWLNLRELSQFAATDTTTPVNLRTIVDTFRNHPALGLWKNFDEAWWGGVSVGNLSNGYYVIRQEDLNHPVVQTHAPRGTVADLQPYNAAADVLALDIYPVASSPPSNPPITNTGVSQLGDWTKVLGQVANGQKQYWMVEQIAFSGTTPPGHTLVFPTFLQSRYMAYEAIINGARGLMFFGGNIAATLNAQDAPYGWNWTFWTNVLKPVVQELGDKGILSDALLTTNSTRPITLSGTTVPDLEFIVREAPPYLYILASKREGTNVNATFSGLPAGAVAGQVLYEWPRMVPVQGGQFTDTFAPLAVHVYRFNLTTPPPSITGQPQSRTNTTGTTATFSVTASGSGPLGYQWRKNGASLSQGGNVMGTTNLTLTLTNVQLVDAGSYSVVVSNSGGLAVSAEATLTVPGPLSITLQPTGLTNNAGTSAAFSVTVSGASPQYQWRKNTVALTNGANVSGATSATLLLANLLSVEAGTYSVVVTNQFNSLTSLNATLTVLDPAILSPPHSQTVNPGSTAVFSVSASGTPTLAYTWRKGGLNLSDGGNVAGAATAALTLASVQSGDAANYSVVVSNSAGSVTSADAVLSLVFPMPYYEPFNYSAGANLGGQVNGGLLAWNDVGTGVSGPYMTVYAGSLPMSGLPASAANSIRFGGLGKSARLSFAPGTTFTSGTLYYSFILKILDTTGLSASGIFFAGFNNATGTQSPQPSVIGTRLYIRSASGGFNLGVAKNSSTASDWNWDSRVFTNNQVILVVGGYTFSSGSSSDDVCTLWLNPSSSTLGSASPPAASATATTGSDIQGQIASFVFFQRDTTEPALMQADELRIGPTWASVTALPTMLTGLMRLGNGAFQFSYPNSTAQGGVVYASTNLTNWAAIGAATLVAPGVYQFTDTAAASYPRRFYQLRAQ